MFHRSVKADSVDCAYITRNPANGTKESILHTSSNDQNLCDLCVSAAKFIIIHSIRFHFYLFIVFTIYHYVIYSSRTITKSCHDDTQSCNWGNRDESEPRQPAEGRRIHFIGKNHEPGSRLGFITRHTPCISSPRGQPPVCNPTIQPSPTQSK